MGYGHVEWIQSIAESHKVCYASPVMPSEMTYDNHLMTLEEAADFLRLNAEVLRRKARQGEVPAAKIGRQWRFRLPRLIEWLDEGGSHRE